MFPSFCVFVCLTNEETAAAVFKIAAASKNIGLTIFQYQNPQIRVKLLVEKCSIDTNSKKVARRIQT